MSNNIKLDKFYTPINTSKKCIDIAFNEFKDITDIIEPSAGNGSFSNQLNCVAYDIEPDEETIIKQDFLTLKLNYKKGRLIIGNPPFGDRNNLARKFYKKSCLLCDYIAFILPISQLNNIDSLYEFDLVKSIELEVMSYSGIDVKCCFNLYKRPSSGLLNKKNKLKSSIFSLIRSGDKEFDTVNSDFMFCKRGHSAGKEILNNSKRYSDEYKVVVHDKKNIQFVKETILGHDWKKFKKHQSSPNISKNDVYRIFE